MRCQLGPIFEATSPQELGGYTYSGDNPVSSSDPTGMESCGPVHFCSGNNGTYGTYHAENDPGSKKYKGSSHYCDTHKCSSETTPKKKSSSLSTAIVCGRVCVVTKENAEKKKEDEAAAKAERARLASAADKSLGYLDGHIGAGFTVCWVLCGGGQYAHGGAWGSIGGLGFGGFGKAVSWATATPEEQGSVSYSLCVALEQGGCINFGEEGHSGSGKWWFGLSYAPGVGAFASMNYSHEIAPWGKSWSY
ncbi:hypothetical protein RKD27_009365 [Streptomyces sp. SAI-126]